MATPDLSDTLRLTGPGDAPSLAPPKNNRNDSKVVNKTVLSIQSENILLFSTVVFRIDP